MTEDEMPPALTEGFQKARKAYGVAAGLLLAWELVGITLSGSDRWPATLETPEAAPFVLAALVVYFGIRVSLEWLQCHPERRKRLAARTDFTLSHIIGVASLTTYAVQQAIEAQLFDLLQPRLGFATLAAWAAIDTALLTIATYRVVDAIGIDRLWVHFSVVFTIWASLLVLPGALVLLLYEDSLGSVLAWSGAGVGVGLLGTIAAWAGHFLYSRFNRELRNPSRK